ncbi:MAG: hypothetical protein A3B17_03015 [Candidatus Yanofskybacteria bacterium RIFCSPLOWO2_01_FULL_45_72]|nr:MAG: hypothetical protein A3B17_03015 [Candidatus Yanofskybacteria bacterium RIFCSPLOWO2_01_FULL_45_72]
MKRNNKLTFIDLFAGIGGFHISFHDQGAKCVFVNEFNPHSKKTYENYFKKIEPSLFLDDKKSENYWRDITEITLSKYEKTPQPESAWAPHIRNIIPKFDILCAGFPCQPFSQAGYKKGFDDARGTLFFDILRIIKAREPSAIFLENVKNLAMHDNGRTFETIRRHLNEIGYEVPDEQGKNWKIVKASDHGLPTNRPRVFIVAFHKRVKNRDKFKFPEPIVKKTSLRDMFGSEWPDKIGYTLRVGGAGSGINDRRNWDAYLVNGKPHRITPTEGLRMMGFPSDFVFPSDVSNVQALKQLGNSVAVNGIRATAKNIISILKDRPTDK